MIGQVMANSALNTKIHAMSGQTLHKEDYDALKRLRSVSEVAAYLKENTRYAKALQDVIPAIVHRGRLENALKEQLVSDVEALLPFLDMNKRVFMDVFELEEGVEKLKIFLRLLVSGHPEQFALITEEIPTGHEPISAKEISKLKTFDAFFDFISGTPFYRPLSSFKNDPERQHLFLYEVSLDNYMAELLNRYAKKYLKKEDQKLAERSVGTITDLDNIKFLLRAKLYFAMTDEEIYAGIIPRYYRLKQPTIAKVVAAPSYAEAVAVLQEETPYGEAFSSEDRFIEKRIEEYLLKLNRHLFLTNPYSIQAPLCYIYMRRVEIKNIVSIIEGIRYGLSEDAIAEHLIGYNDGEAAV